MNTTADRILSILEKLIGGGGLFWSFVLILTGVFAWQLGYAIGMTTEIYQNCCAGVVGAGLTNFGAAMNARKNAQAEEAAQAAK